MPKPEEKESTTEGSLGKSAFMKKYGVAILLACGLLFAFGYIVYKFFSVY